MGFSQEYSFSAPPEVVFNSLIDPDRATRWLPPSVSLQRLDSDLLAVHADGHPWELRIAVDRQAMRVDSRPVGGSGLAGSAVVGQAPAGGSSLTVKVDGADAGRVEPLVEEAIQRLRDDVSDNFNAG